MNIIIIELWLHIYFVTMQESGKKAEQKGHLASLY